MEIAIRKIPGYFHSFLFLPFLLLWCYPVSSSSLVMSQTPSLKPSCISSPMASAGAKISSQTLQACTWRLSTTQRDEVCAICSLPADIQASCQNCMYSSSTASSGSCNILLCLRVLRRAAWIWGVCTGGVEASP